MTKIINYFKEHQLICFFAIHLLVLVLGIIYVLCFDWCVIHKITGYNCPSCGVMRAFFAFFRGDFKLAFEINPLFIPLTFAFLSLVHLFLFKQHRKIQLTIVVIDIVIYVLAMIRWINYLINL